MHEHRQFTCKEIEKLKIFKRLTNEYAGELRNNKSLFPNTVYPYLYEKKYDEHSNKIEEKSERLKKYGYLIFKIVQENDWWIPFHQWLDKMSPKDEIGEYYYYSMNITHVFLSNLIATQYPANLDPVDRLIRALYTERGYEKGNTLISEIYNEETNIEFKDQIGIRIDRNKTFEFHKSEILKLFSSESFEEMFLDWRVNHNLSLYEAKEVLTELDSVMMYMNETKNDKTLESKMDIIFDSIWDEIDGN